eukprot:886644-Pyramimonas_sp.AAC.1
MAARRPEMSPRRPRELQDDLQQAIRIPRSVPQWCPQALREPSVQQHGRSFARHFTTQALPKAGSAGDSFQAAPIA